MTNELTYFRGNRHVVQLRAEDEFLGSVSIEERQRPIKLKVDVQTCGLTVNYAGRFLWAAPLARRSAV